MVNTLKDVIDSVVNHLITPSEYRSVVATRTWPDYKACPTGFYYKCVSGVIESLLLAKGWHKVGGTEQRECFCYGRLLTDNTIEYIRLIWDTENDSFNPYEHISLIEPPTHSRIYIEEPIK